MKNKEGKDEPWKRGKKDMNKKGKGRAMEEREERDEQERGKGRTM